MADTHDDDGPTGASAELDRLEELSREIEQLATRFASRSRAFGTEYGQRPRVGMVKGRLKIAVDELDGIPMTAEDITDE